MSCVEAAPLLEAALDDELDARSTMGVEEHVGSCAACASRRAELVALQSAAREHLVRFELPAALERRLLRGVRPRKAWRYALPAAAAAAALAAVVFAAPDPLAGEVAAAHFRSLQADHLLDVATSDQHTVKPWFQGKVDFGVPVRDFSAQGFPLLGGRLDYLDGHPVAAVVYLHGAHRINLFAWPSAPRARRTLARRGFNEVRWSQDGLALWLVSDAAAADLEKLAALVAAP